MRAVKRWRGINLLMAALLLMLSGSSVAKMSFFHPAQGNIESLTAENNVVSYLRQNHRLPDFYVTKRQARDAGWDARAGNLCQVLPGKAIGGDRFSNREQSLPSAPGRVWREADINYHCGRRGADRVLFANDGLIYVSRNHYKNVVRVE
ncbi:ribonuclease [Rouxiella sp. S1S-2]|nr:ribonuclease [Rouxiella sp. S1S-2]